LFCPPLEEPEEESSVRDSSRRRDAVFPNHAETGFWREARNDYQAHYVVLDSKNYTNSIGRDQVREVASKYLDAKGVGLFAIIISRQEPSPTAKDECFKRWRKRDDGEMILLLTDEHLRNMIKRKETGQAPEKELKDLIDTFRMGYES
jgi:hypothetical protein